MCEGPSGIDSGDDRDSRHPPPGGFQRARTLVEGGPGGHHVIDQPGWAPQRRRVPPRACLLAHLPACSVPTDPPDPGPRGASEAGLHRKPIKVPAARARRRAWSCPRARDEALVEGMGTSTGAIRPARPLRRGGRRQQPAQGSRECEVPLLLVVDDSRSDRTAVAGGRDNSRPPGWRTGGLRELPEDSRSHHGAPTRPQSRQRRPMARSTRVAHSCTPRICADLAGPQNVVAYAVDGRLSPGMRDRVR